MRSTGLILAAIATCAGSPTWAQGSPDELTGVVARYLNRWNAYDAASMNRDYLDLPATHPWSSQGGIAAMFNRLKAEGYSHSTVSSLNGCLTGADTGKVELIYSRIDTKGQVISPARRMSIYDLKRGDFGWRITAINPISGAAQEQGLRC